MFRLDLWLSNCVSLIPGNLREIIKMSVAASSFRVLVSMLGSPLQITSLNRLLIKRKTDGNQPQVTFKKGST